MLRAALFSLVASLLVPAPADQVPLDSGPRWQDKRPVITSDDNPAEWSLVETPNPNGTDHLVFETVYSLLQHWPNIRTRNGHNIVPGIIPQGTVLYHGRDRNELPPGPEWVALDPEHSYCFCTGEHGCWQLTLTTTRPLKVVYFDGKSAANLPYGSLDTQDLLAWGELRPDYMWEETKRIEDLCAWGKRLGVDGFVRMEVSFEVMLCNFTSGVSIVSFANIVRAQEDMATRVVFEALYAGSWHSRFPGETRIHLDLTGLISFYDTQLVPSLVAARAGQERRLHRVGDVSKEDLSAALSRLEAALIRPEGLSSGIDWRTLILVVVDRYAGRLELTQHLLSSPATSPYEILDRANKTQTLLRIMLTPYILLSAIPTDPSDKDALDWTAPIFKECATTHTSYMEPILNSMTDSEKLLLQAVRGTSREICRVVTKMWAAGVYTGIDSSLNTMEPLDVAQVTRLWDTWGKDLNQLMAWLDWSVWVNCKHSCGPEEICLVHNWPANFSTPFGSRGMPTKDFGEKTWMTEVPERDEWIPEPKCISRVAP